MRFRALLVLGTLLLGVTQTAKADIIDMDISGVAPQHRELFQRAETYFTENVANDFSPFLPRGFVFRLDRIQITASTPVVDGVGGTLGRAGVQVHEVFDGLAVAQESILELDEEDITAFGEEVAFNVIIHEMLHAVGFNPNTWGLNTRRGFNLLDPNDPALFVGRNGVQAYQKEPGGDPFARAVPLDNTGGAGTGLAHHREFTILDDKDFLNGPSVRNQDIMMGVLDVGPESLYLSGTTVGMIRDVHLWMTRTGYQGGGRGPRGWKRPPLAFGTSTAIPEPGSACLIALAFGGLALRRRR